MKGILLALFLFAAVAQAVTYTGDGTYEMQINESVLADNHLVVYLKGIDLVNRSANFSVKMGNYDAGSPTIGENRSWSNGNLTIRVNGLRAIFISFHRTETRANVTITSAPETVPTPTPTPVPQEINFYNISVRPGYEEAYFSFDTDQVCYSYIYYSSNLSEDPVHWREFSNPSRGYRLHHEHTVGSLQDGMAYGYRLRCVNGTTGLEAYSSTGYFSTPPHVPVISGLREVNVTNQSAAITWQTDVGTNRSIVFYAVEGHGFAQVEFTEASALSHSRRLDGLLPNTTYQYKVRTCRVVCSDSGVATFRTRANPPPRVPTAPYVSFNTGDFDLAHGSGATIMLSVMDTNPGGSIASSSISWQDGGRMHNFTPVMGGNSRSFLPPAYSDNSVASLTFQDVGRHTITLSATNAAGLSNTTSITINVLPKTRCLETSARYYPQDTDCNKDWAHGGGGGSIGRNNHIDRCNAVEVCSPEIDYLNWDAESCCSGWYDFSDLPEQRYYSYDKAAACDQAVAETRDLAVRNLSISNSMKLCKAKYLVKGIGTHGIYMKDYYTAETCCKGDCEDYPHWQSWNPWPASNIKFSELWCYWTDYGTFNRPKDGWWNSDTDPSDNNMAIADIPTHASINIMNTGTCADYSFAVATALRKAGYGDWEIFSVSAPCHRFNIILLPGASNYTFIDTTPAAEDFFVGEGAEWDCDGHNSHCSFYGDKCSNDRGWWHCPDVQGCD